MYYSVCYQAGIRAYPTVMFYASHTPFKQGQEITSQTVSSIIEFVNDALSSHTTKLSDHDEL